MHHMRVIEPSDGVLAFYDGRVDGYRFADGPNWVDDGALSLGIASYAVVSGGEAMIYDTHVSVRTPASSGRTLEARGIRKFIVVLSHWHLDHVAGTAVFGDCEVIASGRTAELLARHKQAIEDGALEGPPGDRSARPADDGVLRSPWSWHRGHRVELIDADIHSDDATVVVVARRRLLLCGDTMEDTVTYVDEPENFALTSRESGQASESFDPERILPNHGDPQIIAAGGYGPGLIGATEQYIRALQRSRTDRSLREAEPARADRRVAGGGRGAPTSRRTRRSTARTSGPCSRCPSDPTRSVARPTEKRLGHAERRRTAEARRLGSASAQARMCVVIECLVPATVTVSR